MLSLSLDNQVFKIGLTERVKQLKKRVAESSPWASSERAVLITRAYQETEGQPVVIRRAMALKKILEEMSINIADGELIVGNQGTKPLECLVFPEIQVGNLEKELDTMDTRPWDPVKISEKDKEILKREVFPYWKGKSTDELVYSKTRRLPELSNLLYMNPAEYPISGTGIVDHSLQASMGGGHSVFSNKVLTMGLEGIRGKVQEHLRALKLTDSGAIEKKELYDAMLISIEAVIAHANRYADLALVLSEKADSTTRREELIKIAETCRRVPAKPARSFSEALQAFWFILMAIRIESGGVGDSAGRFDQWAYPYFKKDLDEGKLTLAEALEYIQCLWVKFSEINYWKKEAVARFHVGLRPQHLCTGGQTENGLDATNDLSLLCLQASIDVGLQNPAIRVRLHKNSPEEYIIKTAELVASGMGHPSIFNDDVCIKQLMAKGVPLLEARDYTMVGCPAVQLPCKEPGFSYGGLMNLAAALELALNNGFWKKGNRQVGPQTGDPRSFSTFEELMEALKQQVEYMIEGWQMANLIVEDVHAKLLPTPFHSTLIENCIEKGLDKTGGGAKYNFNPYISVVGFADTTDSLVAIKKLIYEDKALSWEELLSTLEANFSGNEILRQRLLNLPKYGNDDDLADSIAQEVVTLVSKAMKAYSNNMRGADGPSGISLISLGANVSFGKVVGALPNGRPSGGSLADASSPVHGCDRNGPTAILKSSSKLDHVHNGEPSILNLWFTPSALENPYKLVPLLRGFTDLGVSHVQMNSVSRETLLDAQAHPENYRTLLVRVSGYNAYFTELDKEIQDDIIDRTPFAVV